MRVKESELRDLRAELRELRDESKSLNQKVIALTEKLGKVKSEPVVDVKPNVSEEHSSGEEESDESSLENNSSNHSENSRHSDSLARTPRQSTKQPHPPGFKEMQSRIRHLVGNKVRRISNYG